MIGLCLSDLAGRNVRRCRRFRRGCHGLWLSWVISRRMVSRAAPSSSSRSSITRRSSRLVCRCVSSSACSVAVSVGRQVRCVRRLGVRAGRRAGFPARGCAGRVAGFARGGGVLGQGGTVADRRGGPGRAGGRFGGGLEHGGVKIGVSVDERAVHAGSSRGGGDADVGPRTVSKLRPSGNGHARTPRQPQASGAEARRRRQPVRQVRHLIAKGPNA